MTGERTVLAKVGATAWLNAAIASGQSEHRPALYRTLSIEFFGSGVQFVGCDGTMLFRTWAPYSDIGDLPAPHPELDEAPEDTVVVSDADKFALGFMRTLLSAAEDYQTLSFSVAPVDQADEPPLGEELTKYALTLTALGQHLACPLFDGQFPAWRALEYGLDPAELVDGMTLATRLFQSVGKLRGVSGVDCSFRGEDRAIHIRSKDDADASIRGLLMPMRRPERQRTPAAEPEQTSHAEAMQSAETTVSVEVGGETVAGPMPLSTFQKAVGRAAGAA